MIETIRDIMRDQNSFRIGGRGGVGASPAGRGRTTGGWWPVEEASRASAWGCVVGGQAMRWWVVGERREPPTEVEDEGPGRSGAEKVNNR